MSTTKLQQRIPSKSSSFLIPFEMNLNQNFDLELHLTAGGYLFVFGEMDVDGFYHSQLLSVASSMVLFNFIERVMDEDEPVILEVSTSAIQ